MDRRRLLQSATNVSHETTPVTVSYFSFALNTGYGWGEDQINGQNYDVSINVQDIWIKIPSFNTPGALTTPNSMMKIDCSSSDPTFELAAGQYRTIMEFSGYQGDDAAGHTREISAALSHPDGTVATTATAYDSQLGNPDLHALIIPGLYIPASGKYSFSILMQPVADLEQGGYYTHSVRLERLDENA